MNMAQKPGNYPSGLSEDRLREAEIRQIAEFYDSLTEAEWVAHYEADYVQDGCTHLIIPAALTDTVGRIIAQAEPERRPSDATERSPTPAKQSTPPEGNFPPGWNLERAQRLIAEMAAAETQLPAADEAELRIKLKGKVSVQVPNEIVPAVRELLANHDANALDAGDAGKRSALPGKIASES